MTTHRNASILIENKTGKTLLSISVSHKYSDVYKNQYTWENVKDGANTSGQPVDFNTGFLTTGRDWWVVTWVDQNGDTYITDPENLRDILDFFEKIGSAITGPLAVLITVVAVGDPEPSTKAVAAAVAVTSTIATALLNTESTDGFKQHILRNEDTTAPTRIIIKTNEVEFNSTSGVSTTGFRKLSGK